MPTEPSPGRIRAARILAVAADFLQLIAVPAFSEGVASPVNDALDLLVAVAMIGLLGWHWAFLPTFLAELVPLWDIVPNWTAAVFFVTRHKTPGRALEAKPPDLDCPPGGSAGA